LPCLGLSRLVLRALVDSTEGILEDLSDVRVGDAPDEIAAEIVRSRALARQLLTSLRRVHRWSRGERRCKDSRSETG
jgi:hypothetical protein